MNLVKRLQKDYFSQKYKIIYQLINRNPIYLKTTYEKNLYIGSRKLKIKTVKPLFLIKIILILIKK